MRNVIQSFRRLAADFLFGMCRLNEIQFDAPWAQRRSRCG
jgi:hypothetical protein